MAPLLTNWVTAGVDDEKCKYHPCLGPDVSGTSNCKIARDVKEEEALSERWHDTPAAFSEMRT